jgi:thiamine pyrophosphate-dependent acetolactate synthase large subunit-like protein
MTTALRALLEILADEGVDRVFGNPGTTELPFLEALSGPGAVPEYVLGVQEGSVVAMADGYARATRRPAFASLHIAVGTANGLIGILNARRSRTPMVVTAGQQDRRHLLQDPMLGGDLVALASGTAKHAEEVHRPEDLRSCCAALSPSPSSRRRDRCSSPYRWTCWRTPHRWRSPRAHHWRLPARPADSTGRRSCSPPPNGP